MTDKWYKKLIWVHFVFAGIAVLSSLIPGPLFNALFPGSPNYDWAIAISVWLNFISFLLLFSLMLTRIELTPKLEKRIWLSLLVLLAPLIPGAFFDIFPLIVVPTVLIILFLGIMVFFSQRKSTRRILILLSFVVVGFFMKRQHWPLASLLITFSLGILAAGSLIHGIHILQKHKENLYFRIIGSFCSLLVVIGSLAIMFKFQHWPAAGILSYMSAVPVLVTTLFVLITLPGSGFINWKREQQQILTRKILIPWVFLLVYMALKTLLPMPVQQRIFEVDVTIKIPFDMTPYEMEMKDGMEERE